MGRAGSPGVNGPLGKEAALGHWNFALALHPAGSYHSAVGWLQPPAFNHMSTTPPIGRRVPPSGAPHPYIHLINLGFWLLIIVGLLWTSFYTVSADSVGIVQRFGK